MEAYIEISVWVLGGEGGANSEEKTLLGGYTIDCTCKQDLVLGKESISIWNRYRRGNRIPLIFPLKGGETAGSVCNLAF